MAVVFFIIQWGIAHFLCTCRCYVSLFCVCLDFCNAQSLCFYVWLGTISFTMYVCMYVCSYSTFGHHPHPIGYPYAKIHFCRAATAELARAEKSDTQSPNHSLSHSSSLFDVPETEVFASEYFNPSMPAVPYLIDMESPSVHLLQGKPTSLGGGVASHGLLYWFYYSVPINLFISKIHQPCTKLFFVFFLT